MKRVSHSYYVVMCDHGKRGLEAVVHPEDTRRAVVDQIARGEYRHVVFIHHVDGLFVEDVSLELFEEAETQLRNEKSPLSPADIQSAAFDHVRDLIKDQVA